MILNLNIDMGIELIPSRPKSYEHVIDYSEDDIQSCSLTDLHSQFVVGESPLKITDESQRLSKENEPSMSFEYLNAEELSLEFHLNECMRKRNYQSSIIKGMFVFSYFSANICNYFFKFSFNHTTPS